MRRRLNSRAFDPFDEWLETQGLYRKQVARDGSCLFRAVSEQLFMTQTEHVRVRSLCLEYMMLYKEDFQPFLEIPLDHHVFNLQDVREWGGHTEIMAMSRLFKVDFLIYQGIKRVCKATDHGHPKTLMLSFTNGNHYDIVYKKDHASSRGFCQSVVYDILYSKVFKLKDVRLAVDTMLHDKEYATLRRDSANSAELKEIGALVEKILGTSISRDNSQDEGDKNTSTEERPSLEEIHPDDVRGLLAHGIPPFPYKVAKSLDPDIYRNIEYDAWNTVRREARYGPFDSNGFQAGVKVLIKLELLPNRQEVEDLRKAHVASRQGNKEATVGKVSEERVDVYHGHIQEMSENKGPVDVYIEEIGSRLKVPYESLEKVPSSPPWSPCHTHQLQQGSSGNGSTVGPISNYKNLSGYYKKPTLTPESDYPVSRGKKKGGKQSREVLTFFPINTSLRYCTPPSSAGVRGRGMGSPSAQGNSPRAKTPQGSHASCNPKNYSSKGMGRGNSSNYRNNESPAREAFQPFPGAVNVGMSVEGVWAVRPNINQSNHIPPPAPQNNLPSSSAGARPPGAYCPSPPQPPPMQGEEASRGAGNDMSQMQMRAMTEALQQVMSAGGQQEVRVTGQQLEVVSVEERAVQPSGPLIEECPQGENADATPQVEQATPDSMPEQKGNEVGPGTPLQGAHHSPIVEDHSLQIEPLAQTQYMHPSNGEMQPTIYTQAGPMYNQLAGSPSPHNGTVYTVSYPPPYPSPGLFQVFTPVPDSSGTPEFTPPPPVTSLPSRPETWDGQGQMGDAESMKVNQGLTPVMVYHMPVMFGGYDYSYNPWTYPVPVMPSPPMEMVPPPPMGAPPHQNYPPPYHHDSRDGRERPPFHHRGRGRGCSPHHYNQHRGHHQNNQHYNAYPGNNYHGGQNHYNNSYGSPMGRGSGAGGQRSLPPRFQRGGGGPRHQYPSPASPHPNQRSHQYEGQPLMHMNLKSSSENLSTQVVSGGSIGSGGIASPPLVTYAESDRGQGMLPLPPQEGPPMPPPEPVPMAAPPPYPTPPGYVVSGPWMWKMM